jgi:hypothetical protein
MLSKKLGIYIPLSYIFNVKNTVQLKNGSPKIPFHQDLKFSSFDTTNMYSNIPTGELTKLIDLICNQYDINGELKH